MLPQPFHLKRWESANAKTEQTDRRTNPDEVRNLVAISTEVPSKFLCLGIQIIHIIGHAGLCGNCHSLPRMEIDQTLAGQSMLIFYFGFFGASF